MLVKAITLAALALLAAVAFFFADVFLLPLWAKIAQIGLFGWLVRGIWLGLTMVWRVVVSNVTNFVLLHTLPGRQRVRLRRLQRRAVQQVRALPQQSRDAWGRLPLPHKLVWGFLLSGVAAVVLLLLGKIFGLLAVLPFKLPRAMTAWLRRYVFQYVGRWATRWGLMRLFVGLAAVETARELLERLRRRQRRLSRSMIRARETGHRTLVGLRHRQRPTAQP